MKTKVEKEQPKSAEPISNNSSEFNFEQWAREVRPQLLAALHKRGVRY